MKELTCGVADHLLRKLVALNIVVEYENLRSVHNKNTLYLLWQDIEQYTDCYMDEVWDISGIFQPLKQN